MSEKLPRISAKRLIRVLERKGWRLDRSSGSHQIFIHPQTRGTLSVPRHSRDMSVGTLSRILKDAGISREEFRRLLG